MRLKHIDNVTECPYCGSDFGFYNKVYVKGWVNDHETFEKGINGEREKQNWQMYDHLNWGKSSDTCVIVPNVIKQLQQEKNLKKGGTINHARSVVFFMI